MLGLPYRYAMFFHGDNEDNYLFGASIGVVFGNDLQTWEIHHASLSYVCPKFGFPKKFK